MQLLPTHDLLLA